MAGAKRPLIPGLRRLEPLGSVDDAYDADRYGARMSEQLLVTLREAHRMLDLEIEALRGEPGSDQLALARLKKRKLRLRDEIARAADALLPDLLA